jgi:hypothetical protein
LTHLMSAVIFLRHRSDKRLLLHYEDFIADPQRVLRHLLAWADISDPPSTLTHLAVGIPFQGNRLLQEATITLRANPPTMPRTTLALYITKWFQYPWVLILSRLRPSVLSPSSNEKALAN